MTPKEKAEDLCDKFYKGNAISCVDEILQVLWHNHEKNSEKMYRYYIEVKQEIEKL